METFTRKNGYNFNSNSYPRPQKSYFEKHFHSYYELLLFKSGNVRFIIEESCYYPKKNDFFLFAPGVYHHLDVINDELPYNRYVLQFDKTNLEDYLLDTIFSNKRCINLDSSPDILEWFERFDKYSKNYPNEQFSNIDRSLIYELLMLLANQTDFAEPESLSHEVNLTIKNILEYIEDNFTNIHTVEDITNALYISRTYLFYSFKKYLKISPMHYVQSKKLIYARQLIKNGEKPTMVNEKCGIPEYTTFFRLYKKQFGVPPSKKI